MPATLPFTLMNAGAPSIHVDRHSCLAAPYGATHPRTARYFELAISKVDAPVVCRFAGKLKGKAIFADRDLRAHTHIWTEAPYLGMQHGNNKRDARCCQYCFMPLVSDYQRLWRDMVVHWNQRRRQRQRQRQHQQHGANGNEEEDEGDAQEDDLERVLERLRVDRRHSRLVAPAVQCLCGEWYCSKLCQSRAFHEFHGILCPRDDAFSSMSKFVHHTQQTNDIFLFVAKVIARVISRFLTTHDLIRAREPMDMFFKIPWWEVVMVERQVQQEQEDEYEYEHEYEYGNDYDNGAGRVHEDVEMVEYDGLEEEEGQDGEDDCNADGDVHDDGYAQGERDDKVEEDEDGREQEEGEMTRVRVNGGGRGRSRKLSLASDKQTCFQDLLMSTHQLLLDALECNLVAMQRADGLQGHTVDEIWTSCATILSFEFFAAQLGLFEMNNIRMDVDHPLQALSEILDPDASTGVFDGEGDDANATATATASASTGSGGGYAEERAEHALFRRVRAVLAFAREERERYQAIAAAGLATGFGSDNQDEDQEDCNDAPGSITSNTSTNSTSSTSSDTTTTNNINMSTSTSTDTNSTSHRSHDHQDPRNQRKRSASWANPTPAWLREFVGVEGTALFPIICTMNHSCDPNCTVVYTRNGDAHVVAVRDIPRGEELCICYIDIAQDVTEREALLRDYQFRCLCSRCAVERHELQAQAINRRMEGSASTGTGSWGTRQGTRARDCV